MLTLAQFDAISNPIVNLYEQYIQSVLNDIARRLSKMPMTATAAWQMQRLTESGKVYENALDELSKVTGKSKAELQSLFESAGVKTLKFDDSIYKAVGLNPLPLNLSPASINLLKAGLEKTDGIIRNLTMTTAMSGQEAFLNAADLAYMQVSNGTMSYDQAIRSAVKQVASDGLSIIDYASGKQDKLDVAMRRTVLTGVAQTTGQLQLTRANEMNVDLVQTSAHAGARPTHQIWQGRVFSRSGSSSKYPDFVSSTGYGLVDGLCGINCRHSFYPFFEGISENAYNKVDRENTANEKVTLDGKEISQYDASQIQRSIERKIRDWKRQAGAMEAAALNNEFEIAKIREWQANMRSFINQTDLQRQRIREQI
jgi:hypothetical protein